MAEIGADFSIVQDITPADTAIIAINLTPDYFRDVFSKLEFLNAYTYLQNLADKHEIPIIHVSTAQPEDNFVAYRQMKAERRLQRKAPKSVLDRDFDSQFESVLGKIKDSIIAKNDDIFNSSTLPDLLGKNRTRYALIIGFHTETAVLRSALAALDHGVMPVVVSDAVSSYSERIYYEALDIISQSAEIIDSRDLMKRWPDQ
jgi:nicotinamidase-related amidase